MHTAEERASEQGDRPGELTQNAAAQTHRMGTMTQRLRATEEAGTGV